MKVNAFALSLIVILLGCHLVIGQTKKSVRSPKAISAREIANKVLPSVVLIITQDENGNPLSQGSGFVYKPGLVVSNLHVFERATNAIVKNVKSGEISKAVEVVGMNAQEDICIIRIDNPKFAAISIGDSHRVLTGDEIYVASNPKGLEGSFTKGIISSVRERDRAPKREDDVVVWAKDYLGVSDRTLFQIDAAISPGSSGGVLLNTRGEAVGIIKSSVVSGQNLNFAIPIDQLVSIPFKFRHPIQLAGACAFSDRQKEKLKGPVKSVTEKAPYKRIENGKLIETEPLPTSIRVYDRDGNESVATVYTVDGRFAWKNTTTYDVNRLKTMIVQDFGNGKTKEIPFDLEQGIYNRLLNRHFSGSVGGLSDETGMQLFDNQGNLAVWYIKDTKQTYEYDSEGQVRERLQWRNGRIEIRTRYKYKYDNYGNWIERYELTNFPNVTNSSISPDDWIEGDVEYREISYFDQ